MTGPSKPRPDRTRLVVLALVGVVGLVWLLQGLGVPIGGSFMVGDPFWASMGAMLIGLAIGLAWRTLRRPR